jgi:glycosyltransferase involved in cell wall biosynthesis
MSDLAELLALANDAFLRGDHAAASKQFDDLSKELPRNFWIRLSAVWACAKAGRIEEALRRLERIDRSEQLGAAVVADMVRLVKASAASSTEAGRMQLPTDYLRMRSRTGHRLAPFRRIKAGKRNPAGLPFELELPRLAGNGNDYRFIVDAANRSASSGAAIEQRRRALVVSFVREVSEAQAVINLMGAQTIADQGVDLLLVTTDPKVCGLGHPRLRIDVHTFQAGRSLSQLNDALLDCAAGFIVFLPALVVSSPWLLERLAQHFDVSALSAFFFPKQSDGLQTLHPLIRQFDASQAVDWTRERYGFRHSSPGNLVVSTELFKQIGGFDPRLTGLSLAFFELSYRLYLAGAYFLPAPAVRRSETGPRSEIDMGAWAGSPGERLEDYCAGHWWRKRDGQFIVPKVSIYMPSHNNGRFIVESVQSVLDQDFQDLEVCICDDGSSDDTLTCLERAFGGEPRVRVVTSRNGGIGNASNRAVRMARGIYIGQLDSDDVLKPGAIRRLVDYLDENAGVGCVYSSCERIDAYGNYMKPEYSFPSFTREKMMLTSIAHHFRMFRAQSWSRTAGFREDIANAVDYDFFLKLSEVTAFHHIDEIFYQRRWHGNNTSIVNETAQTANTTVVLNKSLWRLGLDGFWEAEAPYADQPRRIEYRRKAPTHRVFFWPDYSAANPYQSLLYSEVTEKFDVMSGDISAALRAISTDPTGGPVIFHLHWTNTFFNGTADAAASEVIKFRDSLSRFKRLGGKVVWTIHNAVSHDSPHVDLERQLMAWLCDAVDRIHVHALSSLPELDLPLDARKVVVVPHGSYVGAYPDYLERAEARQHMGLSSHTFVMVFTGQIRPYKGVERLIAAACDPSMGDSWHLIIAGKANYPLGQFIDELVPENVRARITFADQFIDDHTLQLLYRSADVAVFPYERILTSGSALLALSFGTPAVLPDVGMVRDLFARAPCGFAFQNAAPDSLLNALIDAQQAFRDGALETMRNAAVSAAKQLGWNGVDGLLTFEH